MEVMRVLEDLESAGTGVRLSQPTSGYTRYVGHVQLMALTPAISLRNRFDTFGVEINNSSIALRLEFPANRVVQQPGSRDFVRTRTQRILLGADAQTTTGHDRSRYVTDRRTGGVAIRRPAARARRHRRRAAMEAFHQILKRRRLAAVIDAADIEKGSAMSQETVVVPVIVPIDRYTVLMGAFASRDPGRAPSQNIQIFLSPPPNHDLRTILVFFKVDAPPKLGWKTINALTVFLPPDAFANFYSVLRTEKPIFVQYTLRDNDDLDGFHLTSSGEPVGEGPINHSGVRVGG